MCQLALYSAEELLSLSSEFTCLFVPCGPTRKPLLLTSWAFSGLLCPESPRTSRSVKLPGWGRGGWEPRRAFTESGGHNLGSKVRSPDSLDMWMFSHILTDAETPSLRAGTQTERNCVHPPLPFRRPSLPHPIPTAASTSHPGCLFQSE